jgi:GTP-binding protein HflX
VHLPFDQGALISLFHEQGQVERIEHNRKGVTIQGRLPGRLVARYTDFTAPLPIEAEPDEA